MSKTLCYLFSLVLFLSSCSSGVIQRDSGGRMEREKAREVFNGIKKKVALLTFFNESPAGGPDLGIVATEELRNELAKTGEFLIDPMAGRDFGVSKEIYAGGGTRLIELTRGAKVQGVNLIIYGRVLEARVREKNDEIGFVRQVKSYTEAAVEVRIFDVNSNKEIFYETLKGYADDSTFRFYGSNPEEKISERQELLRYGVRVAVRRSIPKISDISAKMDWVGRVAKIIGSKIYVNAGRNSGINIGDILKVITEGSEIYDPETGALIGKSKGEIKGAIEIIDYFGADGSIAILHSGGSVLEGDFVQLY